MNHLFKLKRLHLLIVFIILQAVAGAQVINQVDSLGMKQGTHIQRSGKYTYYRNYKNDTLNGYFLEINPNGDTITTGNFKKGLHDSIWTYYYPNHKVEEIARYKLGVKQGISEKFYENGHKQFIGVYEDNNLTNQASYFYKNGSLKAIGNRIDGKYIEYFENGVIKFNATYEAGNLIGQAVYFSIDGDTLIPRIIYPQETASNTSIVNNTDLSVTLVFSTQESIISKATSNFEPTHDISICASGNLIIQYGQLHIVIKPDYTIVTYQQEYDCEDTIKSTQYTTNRVITTLPNDEFEVTYIIEKKHTAIALGELEINREQMVCDDTGKNPVKIIHNGSELSFNDIGNLIYFEHDTNMDGISDLYIIDYRACQRQMKIFRVEVK